MIPTTDGYQLSTGKEFYANCGILGLNPRDLDLSEGYDGTVEMDGDYPESKFTHEERVEIADYMIDLWRKWPDAVAAKAAATRAGA